MGYRGGGAKGKRSAPITAWSREEKIRRSASSLWGASKYSYQPSVFIANATRPVASVLADIIDGRSAEAKALREYSDTNFHEDSKAMTQLEKDRSSYRNVALDTEALVELAAKPNSKRGLIANAILSLYDGSERYIEPNAALISRDAIPSRRGDLEIITTQIKYLAYLVLGEVAIAPQPSKNNKDAA